MSNANVSESMGETILRRPCGPSAVLSTESTRRFPDPWASLSSYTEMRSTEYAVTACTVNEAVMGTVASTGPDVIMSNTTLWRTAPSSERYPRSEGAGYARGSTTVPFGTPVRDVYCAAVTSL